MQNMFGGGNNDTRMGMMGNSPSPYNNGPNPGNNGGGNASSNPFGAMLANSVGNGNNSQPIQGNNLRNNGNPNNANNINNQPNYGNSPQHRNNPQSNNFNGNSQLNNSHNPMNAAAILGGAPNQNQANQQPLMHPNSQPPVFGNNGQNYPPGYNNYHHPMHTPVTQAPNLNTSNVGFQQPIGQSTYYRPAEGAYESEKRSHNSQEEQKMRKKFKLPEAAMRNFKKFEENLEY